MTNISLYLAGPKKYTPICYSVQEAKLPQRDHTTRYVSKFVLCFTSYGSYKGVKQQK